LPGNSQPIGHKVIYSRDTQDGEVELAVEVAGDAKISVQDTDLQKVISFPFRMPVPISHPFAAPLSL